MTPPRPPWDDGRLDDVGPDQFGPGDADPAIYQVEATVLDVDGCHVDEGEEFRATFGTAARTADYAIRRAEMFFQGSGFEVVSEFDTERYDIGSSPSELAEHLDDVANRDDTDGISFI